MRRTRNKAPSFTHFCGWALLFLCVLISTYVTAKDSKSLEQVALKEVLREQILREVGDKLRVEQDQITVYLDDRRLVVPRCKQNFVILY